MTTDCMDSTIHCPPAGYPSAKVWAAVRTHYANAVRDYRTRRAAHQFERLDPGLLRDIGVTGSGARTSALELSREIAG